MIGIENLAVYLPAKRQSNSELMDKFSVTETFLEEKIGFTELARKLPDEKSSDLCCKAFAKLIEKQSINLSEIDFMCVCTQNGDFQLPQTSAILQDKLGLSTNCATFDISLGCSGYPYSLQIAKSFMEQNSLLNGLVFTADPYSEILNQHDKNTSLLFGDASTVTLLSNNSVFDVEKAVYSTFGNKYTSLIKYKDAPLVMKGREIFNFCITNIPNLIERCLKLNQIESADVDYYLLHQASKYMIMQLIERMSGIDKSKVPFTAMEYGNTVSSSIPILLENFLDDPVAKQLLICGFGVGLSGSACILKRRPKK